MQHLEQSSGMARLLYGSVMVSPVCKLQNVFSSVQVSVLKTTSISTHVQPLPLELDELDEDDELDELELDDDELELDDDDELELDELDEDEELDELDEDEEDDDSGEH